MKTTFRLLVIGILHIFFFSTIQAQDKPVTFGVRAGGNVSVFGAKLNESNLASVNSKFGMMAGLTVDFAFSENAYLLTGVDFATKGVKEQRQGHEESVSAMYLNMPIHFGYKVKNYDQPVLVLRGGPFIGYGIGGNREVKSKGTKTDTFQSEGYGFKKFDYGLGIGVGTEVPMENGAIAIDVGFNLGLPDISEAKEGVRTRDIYLTLGYKF